MHHVKSPRSLFRSTATTVALALFLLQFIVIAATVNYVVLPMAKRSADDLSALLVLSAQTWMELPPETRKDFELELIRKHQFMLFEDLPPLPARTEFLPYMSLLDSALSARTGTTVSIKVTELETTWFWADIPTGDKLIRIGFPKERLDINPPLMLLLALVAMIVMTLFTALILARRITEPLSQFSLAIKRIGAGELPEPLPETDIKELSGLALSFNQMALQVRELLTSRTIMLAGISHDLRTPLARMRLAIEMLPDETDPKQIARLQQDIDYMNRLIGEFFALSRDMQMETPELIDITGLLQELADDLKEQGVTIEWQPQGHILRSAGPISLRRIVSNLLGNAHRYGASGPITINLETNETSTVIRVFDRGPGIPAAELENVFRPFYRLESSRNHATGGTGLGLAIARQLSEANGWNIELLPRSGGGTEARLTLPLQSK